MDNIVKHGRSREAERAKKLKSAQWKYDYGRSGAMRENLTNMMAHVAKGRIANIQKNMQNTKHLNDLETTFPAAYIRALDKEIKALRAKPRDAELTSRVLAEHLEWTLKELRRKHASNLKVVEYARRHHEQTTQNGSKKIAEYRRNSSIPMWQKTAMQRGNL